MADDVPKITESQLRAWLMDPDVPDKQIAPYLIPAPGEGTAFDPVVIPNPALVTPSAEEAAVLMSSVNRISRWRRGRAYEKKLKTWTGPRLVAEGDSWFQYPVLLQDVIDQLDAHYAIRCLSAAGDLVSDMVAQDELVATIAAENPDGVLLSGGGNDLLGDGRLALSLHRFDPALAPNAYLTPAFDAQLSNVIGLYRDILGRIIRTFPGLPVFIHGYDHALPNSGRWLGRPMQKLGIEDVDLQAQIVAHIVNRFYDALGALVVQPGFVGQVELIDCRGLVRGQWHDELHPRDPGYKRVADKFHERIKTRLATESPFEAAGAVPAGPAGLEAVARAAQHFARTADDDILLSELGRRAMLASTDLDHQVLATGDLRGAALEGVGDVFRDLGSRILKRLNRQLNQLICGDDPDAKQDRDKLAKALGLDEAAVAGVLVQILVGSLGVMPAVATIIAALLLKHVLRPSLEEVCEVWTDNLNET